MSERIETFYSIVSHEISVKANDKNIKTRN